MSVKNYNIRFRDEKEKDRKAWEHLHSKEVRDFFRSQNGFVIDAINDYYDRHICIKKDPYLETREKEDAFADRIIKRVEGKFLDNLPEIIGRFMIAQENEIERRNRTVRKNIAAESEISGKDGGSYGK